MHFQPYKAWLHLYIRVTLCYEYTEMGISCRYTVSCLISSLSEQLLVMKTTFGIAVNNCITTFSLPCIIKYKVLVAKFTFINMLFNNPKDSRTHFGISAP